jgi:hypothetical protein
MATTTKATSLKTATTKKVADKPAPATSTSADTAELEAQVATLTAQVTTLTAQVTNLKSAVSGGAKDTDGDGIPDVAGLTLRVDNLVLFLQRKHGCGPMEQSGVY